MSILSEILGAFYPRWRPNSFPLTTRQKWKKQSQKTTFSMCEGSWGCHTGKYGSEMLGFSWVLLVIVCLYYLISGTVWINILNHFAVFVCVAYYFEGCYCCCFQVYTRLDRLENFCIHVQPMFMSGGGTFHGPFQSWNLYVHVSWNAKNTTTFYFLWSVW